MADNNDLDWTKEKQNISVTVDFEDPTPTPPLTVTPDEDGLTKAAEANAQQLASKTWLKDMRASIAQWILLCGYILSKVIETTRKLATDIATFKATIKTRQDDVEKRMTTQETTYRDLIKELTEADTGDGAAEVITARNSDLYGDFATLDARFESLEAAIAPYVANTSTTATIPVNLGRQVPISVSYYEYALGTEPDGLGTGPYGLGGSEPQDVPYIAISWSDANTAKVALPVVYKDVVADGTLKAMADGSWTLTAGYKTLRFVADA
ncbi:hypothetical protein [Lacticaseibacillus daqingensis]|uniref:hypothetical protein n=1 Tax=Lacticaseibacillus daqingensis TaxID=2486014 RepID=UPI000F76B4BD|nr:hypothetical protein [Lacticaseibacillus daqingensis]